MSLSPLAAQSTFPPGSVDGAVHPEQIPDIVAVRLFLGALRDPSAVASSLVPTAKADSLLPSNGVVRRNDEERWIRLATLDILKFDRVRPIRARGLLLQSQTQSLGRPSFP